MKHITSLIVPAIAAFVGRVRAEHAADVAKHAQASQDLACAITRGDVRGPLANAVSGLLSLHKARLDTTGDLLASPGFAFVERVMAGAEKLADSGIDLVEALEQAVDEEVAALLGVHAEPMDGEQGQAPLQQAEGSASINTEAPAGGQA